MISVGCRPHERSTCSVSDCRAGSTTAMPLFAVPNRGGTQHEIIYGGNWAGTTKLAACIFPIATKLCQRVRTSWARCRGDERNVLIAETLSSSWAMGGSGIRTCIHTSRASERLRRHLHPFEGIVPLISPRVLLRSRGTRGSHPASTKSENLRSVWKENIDAEWKSFALPGFHEDTIDPTHLARWSRLLVAMRDGERYRALYRLDLASRDVARVAEIPDADVSGAG